MKKRNEYTLREKIKAMGPGIMIVGSLIGPGTITSATRAGASFGFALMWTVLFSVIACIVLQGMAARVGVVTQNGLAEELEHELRGSPIIKKIAVVFIMIAIGIGGIAYMGGDITGTAIGIGGIFGINSRIVAPIWGICILFLITKGDAIKRLERLLAICVAAMLIVFVITAIIVKPDFGALLHGLIPIVPEGGIITCAAMIGTTVVPYNLFLHSVSTRKTWHSTEEIPLANFDTTASLSLAGIVTAAVMITAGTVMLGLPVNSATDMAVQLEPLLGSFSRPFLCIGIAAAGISSAVITPLGVSYVFAGLLGWKQDNSDKRFFATNIVIVLTGIFFASTGFNPISLLITAQAVNGFFLPISVAATVYISSRASVMGEFKNSALQNILGICVFLVSLVIGVSSLLSLF